MNHSRKTVHDSLKHTMGKNAVGFSSKSQKLCQTATDFSFTARQRVAVAQWPGCRAFLRSSHSASEAVPDAWVVAAYSCDRKIHWCSNCRSCSRAGLSVSQKKCPVFHEIYRCCSSTSAFSTAMEIVSVSHRRLPLVYNRCCCSSAAFHHSSRC